MNHPSEHVDILVGVLTLPYPIQNRKKVLALQTLQLLNATISYQLVFTLQSHKSGNQALSGASMTLQLKFSYALSLLSFKGINK